MSHLQFVVRDGVLVIGAVERDPTVDLALRREDVLAFVHGGPMMRLAWEHYAGPGRAISPRSDSWRLVRWSGGRGSTAHGIAIGFNGRYVSESEHLRRWTKTAMRQLMVVGLDYPSHVAIVSFRRSLSSAEPELTLLATLCQVLHDRPPLRERLEQTGPMQQLAADLDDDLRHHHRRAHPIMTVRRDPADVVGAMRLAGLQHPYGRPVHASEVVPFETAVERVIDRLEQNPHRTERTTDRALVERIVRRTYSDIEPWPFAALFD